MRTRIVKIGNSRGIRIPKALLDQTGLQGEVEIKAQGGSLVVVAVRPPPRRVGGRVPGNGPSWC